MPTPVVPEEGDVVLAKVPDDLKDTQFFKDYVGDFYPAQVHEYRISKASVKHQ
jgi:hypothetical protein